MRYFVVAMLIATLLSTANATTITLHFNETLFENSSISNLTQAQITNLTAYLQNLSAPAYVVDGFKLRGEDFVGAGQQFYRTYKTPEGNVTVFELAAYTEAKSIERTAILNGSLLSMEANWNITKAELDVAKSMSSPNMWMTAQTAVGMLANTGIGLLFLIGIKIYRDRNGAPQSKTDWMPEYEPKKSLDEGLEEAFRRAGMGGNDNGN